MSTWTFASTLYVMMQLTARVDWEKALSKNSALPQQG
jgi:hypothetical protein